MRSRNSISMLTAAYDLARKAKVLELPWIHRAFVSSYFLYKRFYEDPFRGLIRRMPGLFQNGDILDIGAESTRPYTGIPDPHYPFHDRTVNVTSCGRICFGSRKITSARPLPVKTPGSRRSPRKSGW